MPRESGPGFVPGQETGEPAPKEEIKEGPGMFAEALSRAGMTEEDYRSGIREIENIGEKIDMVRSTPESPEKRTRFDELSSEAKELKRRFSTVRTAEYIENDVLPFEERLRVTLPDDLRGQTVDIARWRLRSDYDYDHPPFTRSTGSFPNDKVLFVRYCRKRLFEGKEWEAPDWRPGNYEVIVGEETVVAAEKPSDDNQIVKINVVSLEDFSA